MGDKWLLHKFEIAVKDLQEYKKHILRTIHKDRAEEVLMIFDNAMKFLPQKFREAQTDFFAKKGIKKITGRITFHDNTFLIFWTFFV